MRKMILVVGVLIVALLLVTGCGKKDFNVEGVLYDTSDAQIEELIGKIHSELNGLVCYSNEYRMAGTDEAKATADTIIKCVEELKPMVKSEALKQDLEMLVELVIRYAEYDHSNNPPTEEIANVGRWAHRIAHDLDYRGTKGDYHKATITFEGKDSKALKFLNSLKGE